MAPTRPLSELQVRVLLAMDRLEEDAWPNTPNEIGWAAGAKVIQGNGRTMGYAQQIIPALNGLSRRGLIDFTSRRDRLSGTAYYLTKAGKAAVLEERANA